MSFDIEWDEYGDQDAFRVTDESGKVETVRYCGRGDDNEDQWECTCDDPSLDGCDHMWVVWDHIGDADDYDDEEWYEEDEDECQTEMFRRPSGKWGQHQADPRRMTEG